jgi:hypothetical protein
MCRLLVKRIFNVGRILLRKLKPRSVRFNPKFMKSFAYKEHCRICGIELIRAYADYQRHRSQIP